MTAKTFKAKLIKVADMNATYVNIPFDVEKTYGKKGQVKVKANIEGIEYRGSIAKMQKDAPHILVITQAIRKQINKSAGDEVKISLVVDTEKREVEIPKDLNVLLAKHKKAKEFFEKLSYSNTKEYVRWIESAKKAETRENRLKTTIEKLLTGHSNPSQK